MKEGRKDNQLWVLKKGKGKISEQFHRYLHFPLDIACIKVLLICTFNMKVHLQLGLICHEYGFILIN